MSHELLIKIVGMLFVMSTVFLVGGVFLWKWGDPKRDRSFRELFDKIFRLKSM